MKNFISMFPGGRESVAAIASIEKCWFNCFFAQVSLAGISPITLEEENKTSLVKPKIEVSF